MSRQRKRELRGVARAKKVPDDPDASARVVAGALTLPEVGTARTVALFAAVEHEPELDALESALVGKGARVVYPRVEGADLAFCEALRAQLQPGYRGLLEPQADAPRVDTDRIDLFFVPGLLFDRAGRRLGRGLGHYDRALRHARGDAVRVGLCYANRIVTCLPHEPHDERVDLIVTECRIWRVASAECA